MHPQPISGTCSPPVCIKFSLLARFSLEPITNWLKKPEKEDFSCLSCTKIGEALSLVRTEYSTISHWPQFCCSQWNLFTKIGANESWLNILCRPMRVLPRFWCRIEAQVLKITNGNAPLIDWTKNYFICHVTHVGMLSLKKISLKVLFFNLWPFENPAESWDGLLPLSQYLSIQPI